MKFTIEQKQLYKALAIVQRCISQKALQDVLNNVLIEVGENEVVLTAHDHKLGCEIHVPANVSSPSKFLVNANLLHDFIRKLPETSVVFEKNDSSFLTITAKGAEIKLLTVETDLFPKLSRHQISENIMIPSLVLKDMLRMTIFAASTDENMIQFNSSLLEISEDTVSLVSCELFRVAYKKTMMKTNLEPNEYRKYLIPTRASGELYKVLQQCDENEVVNISLTDTSVEFTLDGLTITSQLIDKQFVDYKKIIPRDFKTKVIVDKKRLYDALDRASLLVKMKDDGSVIFDIKDNLISILINSAVGNFREDIPIKLEGVDLEIAFNPRYIIDVLKVIDTEEVIAEFNTDSRPAVIRSTNEDNFIYLALPIKL